MNADSLPVEPDGTEEDLQFIEGMPPSVPTESIRPGMISMELPDGKVIKLPPPIIEGEHGNIWDIDPNNPKTDPFDGKNLTISAPDGVAPTRIFGKEVTAAMRTTREAAQQSVDLYPVGSAVYEKGEFSENGIVLKKWQYCIIDGFDSWPSDRIETFRSFADIAGITLHPDPEQNRVIIKKVSKNKGLSDPEKNFHDLLKEMSQTFGGRVIFLAS